MRARIDRFLVERDRKMGGEGDIGERRKSYVLLSDWIVWLTLSRVCAGGIGTSGRGDESGVWAVEGED